MSTEPWTCKQCHDPLPPTMVQQGGCHLGCFEEWCGREIDVWKIEHDGSCYIVDDMLEAAEAAANDQYTVTRMKMKRGEFEALPEFKGF